MKAPHLSSLKFCIGRWQRKSSRFRSEFATPIHPICIATVLSGAFFFFCKGYEGVHFEVLFLLRVHHGFEACLTWETSRNLSRGRILSYMSQVMGSPTGLGNLQLFMVLGGGLSEVFFVVGDLVKIKQTYLFGSMLHVRTGVFLQCNQLKSGCSGRVTAGQIMRSNAARGADKPNLSTALK